MTPREQAEQILDSFRINLDANQRVGVIEAFVAGMAIAAATGAEKEREACAKTLQDQIDSWNRVGIGSSDTAADALTEALDQIRARS